MEIRKDLPMPSGFRQKGVNVGITATMRKIDIGDCIVVMDMGGVYNAAKVAGVKIKAQRAGPREFRVWRIA